MQTGKLRCLAGPYRFEAWLNCTAHSTGYLAHYRGSHAIICNRTGYDFAPLLVLTSLSASQPQTTSLMARVAKEAVQPAFI